MAHPKAGRPRGTTPPEVLEKERQVVALRAQGMTWAQISNAVGYADPSGSHDAYVRASRRVVAEDIEHLRALEMERLDNLQSAHWLNAIGGDVQAATLVLKIIESRRKMLGLDQPTRIQAEVISYDPDSIQAELARIVASYVSDPTDSSATVQMAELTSQTESDTATE